MKNLKFPLIMLALTASSLLRSQTTYYTVHSGAWNDNTAWSTISIGGTSCSCSPGCTSLTAVVYIGNSITSSNCLSGIGSNAVITIESGDTLTVTVPTKLPVNNSTINILSGGVMIVNGEMDIAVGDSINNSGTLTVNGNISDTGIGAYLAGNGVFTSSGTVTGTTVFVNPGNIWQPVSDSTSSSRTNIVYNNGYVGIGIANPLKPLHVKGNALISDTLNVTAVQTHRVALYPGDSLIRFGDSSVVINMLNNNIYGEHSCTTYPCSPYTSIALGVYNNVLGNNLSCAIGLKNTIQGAQSIAIGVNNFAGKNNQTITIGTGLNNNTTGSIMMGGYNSASGLPALSILPDMTNATPGFIGIGTISPDAVLTIENPTAPLSYQFSINNSTTDVFTIDPSGNTFAAGNVGIGTTTPDAVLSIVNPSSPLAYQFSINNGSADVYTIDPSGNTFAAGNVSIGTEISGQGIEIAGTTSTIISPSQTVSFANDTIATTAMVKAGIFQAPYFKTDSIELSQISPHDSVIDFKHSAMKIVIPENIIPYNPLLSHGCDFTTMKYESGSGFAFGGLISIYSNNFPDVRFGIGTTCPQAVLDIEGNTAGDATPSLLVGSGKVGIGTQHPDAQLYISVPASPTINPFSVTNASGDSVTILPTGQVVIGNGLNTPGTYGLYVGDGGILTNLVKIATVNGSDWSDYVLASNYKLKPLTEVAQFIKENKHLPDVPSATDVENNGIDIAQMDATLLKKIEELTLYIIQQQQNITKEEQQSQRQQKEIEVLKAQLESLEKVKK